MEQAFGLKDMFPDGLTLFANDTWNLIRAAFFVDYKAGRAKLCENPDCPTPYFLHSRKGTKLAESPASEHTLMAIAGEVSRKMIEHDSHIRMQAKMGSPGRYCGAALTGVS